MKKKSMRGFFLGPIIVLITYSIALAWGENSWNDNGEHFSRGMHPIVALGIVVLVIWGIISNRGNRAAPELKITGVHSDGKVIFLSNGEHYSVSPCDSIVTSSWSKLDNVSVTNGIMTNHSQQDKHVDVVARVYTKSHHSSI